MRALAMVAALAVAGTSWHVARACSIDFSGPPVAWPPEGAEDVPTDAGVWLTRTFGVEHVPTARVLFVAADGTVVASEVREPASNVLFARPVSPLAPRTKYTVRGCTADECVADIRTFTTGDGPGGDPPAPPIEHGRELDVDRRVGLCGGTFRTIALDIEFDGLLVLDLGLPELDEVTLQGDVDVLSTDVDEEVLVALDGVSIDGKRADARMGVFDARAAFSGWVEMAPLDFTGCGCASSRASGGASLGWLALVLLARRRRRLSPRAET